MFLLSCWVLCVQKKFVEGLDKMNKLILALALLLTPFFSKISIAFEADSVSPTSSESHTFSCAGSTGTEAICLSAIADEIQTSSPNGVRGVNCFSDITEEDSPIEGWKRIYVKCEYDLYRGDTDDWNASFTIKGWKNGSPSIAVICDNPSYPYGVDTSGSGTIDTCYKDNPNLEKCPEGNYKFKVGGECVPVQCDSAGSQGSIWASGQVYGSSAQAGTYCDGSCAHTVSGGQNSQGYTGNVAISAVATGDSCGQGTDTWLNEGDGGNCQSVDVGTGTNYMTCPDGNVETPPDEPAVDLEPEKADLLAMEELTPTEEPCTIDNAACEVRNLKEKYETEGKEQKKLDTELHNKKLDADTKIADKLNKTINELANRNADGFKKISDSVDGSGDGGSGGGGSSDGVCDTEGNCSTAVETKTEPSEGLTGFWESEYENGLQGVMDEKLIDAQTTEFFVFLEQFNPSISGGTPLTYSMCFNIGALANFGCHSYAPDPRTFPAIKIFILIGAVFLCRKILFGG